MKKSTLFGSLALLALIGGCYTYPDPPSATLGESYTNRPKDGSDEIFQGITSLSLADAQRIALHNNPTYIAAHHAVSAAHMRYLQSFSGYLPTVKAGLDYRGSNSWMMSERPYSNSGSDRRHPRSESNNMTFSMQATLLLFDGLIREFSVLEASHSEKYYQHMDENSCRTIVQAVAYAYNNVLLAIEKRRIADEDRKFQMTSLKDTKYKFDAGAVPLSDVLNFEILMNNADVNMIAADYQYETAVYALAQLLGYPDGTLPAEVTFSGDIKSEFVDLPAVEVYLDTALANRPDLKAYREQLDIAKYQLYQRYGAFSPTASAFFNYTYQLGESRNPDRSYNTRYYSETNGISYGVGLEWVIFSGFARYNRMREYQANVAIADYNVAAQWFQVVNDVRTAYAGFVQSTRTTKILEKVRDLSKQQRDLVDDEYRAGNTELTRLNEAQRDYVTAEANLASSYVNIQNAKAQLDAAVGANTSDYYLSSAAESSTNPPALEKPAPAAESAETELEVPQSTPETPATVSAETPAAPAAPANGAAPIPASATAPVNR